VGTLPSRGTNPRKVEYAGWEPAGHSVPNSIRVEARGQSLKEVFQGGWLHKEASANASLRRLAPHASSSRVQVPTRLRLTRGGTYQVRPCWQRSRRSVP